MAKKILVTGAAGFIGSHLCEYLLEKEPKTEIIGLDNFLTGKKENLKTFENHSRFTFLKHDIIKPLKLTDLTQIYNLASPASPVQYQKYGIETMLANSLGVKNLLDLAVKNKAVFLQASTSEVYGDPLEHPQKESYWGHVNPVGVRGCYDESKRFAEAITMAYHRVHSLDTKIVRIFNTYGPKMRHYDGRVVPNFIFCALNNKPLTVCGKGQQTRSFCYIDDLVEGIYRLMISKINEPVNLGNPDEFTIMQLAKLVLKISGSRSKIVFKPLPED
ncbi:MAG: GDP-mannose 4,6-dehydratase, partial [Candidatus Diapherotrites archaeon]|nr:GDP-mannose 4,6-dehydratase [Candidatus Diapherotrites archaeon]